ncbi:phosphopyruvate hydratase [Rickettsiales bacterium]|jgi:enolase|nr:phosphopyruvate hydratase [Rickettsiales bacterium]|tara:strand:+ start:2105 stop:3382 length:1278 start_codon:yes stop_codon:yes gene_type:complete
MTIITNIKAREIIDSRGYPTLEAEIHLKNGTYAMASVPSGASTGSLEACELRDNNQQRFFGKGVLQAVKNVESKIKNKIIGLDCSNFQEIDQIMIDLDNSNNKSNLGANAILAVSLACAKAAAQYNNIPLFKFLAPKEKEFIMPTPMMNIINGGKHADNKIDIQEFMIMPVSATSIKDAIRIGAEIFQSLKALLKKDCYNTNVGDEGGFAPNISNASKALDYICKATKIAGYEVGKDIFLALDCASTEFYMYGKYHLEEKIINFEQLIQYYEDLVNNYPIFSIEDACAEKDYEGWKLITAKLGNKIQLVGDDLFVTNPQILTQGIKDNIANAILIKYNQIGTLSETLQTINIAKQANYNNIISHRSGETEDATIAHIAVATNAGQIKTGSLCRSDRCAKYNELIRIEEYLGKNAKYCGKSFSGDK